MKTSPELERIGRSCDAEASSVKTYKLPINGEKFLDHEIDEFKDEDGQKPFIADDFKQYSGFYNAGYYSFRNEFSKLFMKGAMDLDYYINNQLADANENAGGDKYTDKLTQEDKRKIRDEARRDFKEDDNNFTVAKAEELHKIITRTFIQIKEGLNFTDPLKKDIYEAFKIDADSIPAEYDNIKVKRELKKTQIAIIDETFADNWGVRESCKDYINGKFNEYVKKFADQIAKDSLQEQLDLFGVTTEMPTKEFYSKIYSKIDFSKPEEYEDFKELIYLRFITKYNKTVEGDWKLEHLPAIQNLENAINDLPDGHFLINEHLTLITNKDYKGGSNGGYAWYKSGEKRINFSANCIDRGTVFGVLANPTEFRSTLYHEIGHSVSMKLGRTDYYDYKKFVVECGWTYESKELRAGMTATGDEKNLPRTGSNSNVKLISDYAGKSPEEAFAEYYSFYSLNKDRIDKYLIAGDENFLKGESKIVCDTETSERSVGSLISMSRILRDDDPIISQFNTVKDRCSYMSEHNKIELVSPWKTVLSPTERTHVDMDKLRRRKDSSLASMPPIVSYLDSGKNIVIDGATRVEVSRMNKKLVPSITISKELYHKCIDSGLSEREITDAIYTKNRHERLLREVSPKVTIHGLIHRDSLISVSKIVDNTQVLKMMAKIHSSKELEKAIAEMFGIEKVFIYGSDIEKAWKKHTIGTVTTRKDGQQYRKIAETGNVEQDWKLIVKEDKEKKPGQSPIQKPGQKQVNEKEKKNTDTNTQIPKKDLQTHAKNASETALQNAIKNSADEEVRKIAHEELDRRSKEEAIQEEKETKVGEKRKIGGSREEPKKQSVKKTEEKKEPKKEESKEEKSTFKDSELAKIDKFINTPEILSRIKIPKVLYHVTSGGKDKKISKEGLSSGNKKTDEVGESEGRVYLSNDPYGIADYMEDAEDLKYVQVSTDGVQLRLDPEYYRDMSADEVVDFANNKPGSDHGLYMYTTQSISKDSIGRVESSPSIIFKSMTEDEPIKKGYEYYL